MTALRSRIQRTAYHIVIRQIIGVFAFALLILVAFNATHALSVLTGGLAYAVPNLLFVWLVFRYSGVQEMHQFLAAFFFGEMFKLILCGILFIVIVKYLPVSLLSVLIGLAAAMVAFWIVCIWRFSKQTTTSSCATLAENDNCQKGVSK